MKQFEKKMLRIIVENHAKSLITKNYEVTTVTVARRKYNEIEILYSWRYPSGLFSAPRRYSTPVVPLMYYGCTNNETGDQALKFDFVLDGVLWCCGIDMVRKIEDWF